jgi:hypothetical protein
VAFGATWNVTTPLPVPEVPLTIVSQVSLLVALHVQPLEVFTFTVPVPPIELND